MLIRLLLLLPTATLDRPLVDTVEVAHHQQVIDSFDGSDRYQHLLFWDPHPATGRLQVRGHTSCPATLRGSDRHGCWVQYQTAAGYQRRIYYRHWCRSRDPWDAESEDQHVVPRRDRIPLQQPWHSRRLGHEGILDPSGLLIDPSD